MRALVAAILIGLAGCSPLARVSENTNAIQTEAQALIDRGEATRDAEVIKRATRIHELAADTHSQLTGLEDKTPMWMSTLWWLAVAAVLIAACVLVWQTGLGQVVRVAIGWLPRRKMQDADLAVNMLDPDKPESAREYVAARRASDPEFNAAWIRANKKADGSSNG